MLVKRRTKLFFHSYFCSDVLISSLLFTREQHCSTANYRRYTTSCRRNRRWRGRTEGTWIPCTGAWVAGPRSWTSDEDVEVPYLRPSLKLKHRPKTQVPKEVSKSVPDWGSYRQWEFVVGIWSLSYCSNKKLLMNKPEELVKKTPGFLR